MRKSYWLLLLSFAIAACKKDKTTPADNRYSIHISHATVLHQGADATHWNTIAVDMHKLAQGPFDTTYDVGNVWYGGTPLEKSVVVPYWIEYDSPDPKVVLPEMPELQIEGNDKFEALTYIHDLPIPVCTNYPDSISKSQPLHLSFANATQVGIAVDSAVDLEFPGAFPGETFVYAFLSSGNQLDIEPTTALKNLQRDSVYVRIFCTNVGMDSIGKYQVNSRKTYSYRRWLKLVD